VNTSGKQKGSKNSILTIFLTNTPQKLQQPAKRPNLSF
jgi:hypothetical protein